MNAVRENLTRPAVAGSILTAVLVVLIGIAVAGFLGPATPGRADEDARRQVQLATADAVGSLMTFGPDSLVAQQQTVGAKLTGRLLLEFRSQGPGVVLPTAVESKVVMTGRVLATAVNRMTADAARVLVFVNQSIVLPAAGAEQEVVAVTRWADMRKVNGNWLLAGLQQVGPG
jgi:Mce-associated membrane protein